MGIQVCPLPTAILSTHLGGFSTVCMNDFSSHIASFSAHWQREGLTFDSIYSGFLASAAQIELVSNLFDDFSANHPLILVDPVMGDNGKLYSLYTEQMQEQIKHLVCKADIITPNYTEACFLLGQVFQPIVKRPELLEPWLRDLADMGPSRIVVPEYCYQIKQLQTSVMTDIPTNFIIILASSCLRVIREQAMYLPASCWAIC